MDRISASQRSANMRAIRSTGMKPEMRVRQRIHAMGYRFRLHKSELPGKPDIVFARRRKVIFVHGCFWHQHKGCKHCRKPKSNQSYWLPKLARNVRRDRKHLKALKESGWKALVIWECQIKNDYSLEKQLRKFLR
ncbi:MAG TPA: DNA mismatch endonuclease Vsr [Xanthobacteraceae bacterium]|nr:DNA mismatch endonuclease Vsr [Xanthobacteraceae bacterium]